MIQGAKLRDTDSPYDSATLYGKGVTRGKLKQEERKEKTLRRGQSATGGKCAGGCPFCLYVPRKLAARQPTPGGRRRIIGGRLPKKKKGEKTPRSKRKQSDRN